MTREPCTINIEAYHLTSKGNIMELRVSDKAIAAVVRHAASLGAVDIRTSFDDQGFALIGIVDGQKMLIGEVYPNGFDEIVNLN